LGGFLIGTLMAMALGPRLASISVYPMPSLLGVAIAISVSISLIASLLPARRAAKIDPAIAFREV